MKGKPITVSYTRFTARFGGANKGLLVLHAERVGTTWTWSGTTDELLCPQQRGADIEASLTAAGYRVNLLVPG